MISKEELLKYEYESENKYILFGDGTWGKFIRKRIIKKDGEKFYAFILLLTDTEGRIDNHLARKFKDINKDMWPAIIKLYPFKYVKIIKDLAHFSRILVYTTPDGDPDTPLNPEKRREYYNKLIGEQHKSLTALDQRVATLKSLIAKEKFKLRSTQKETVNLLREIGKARGQYTESDVEKEVENLPPPYE